MKHAVQLRLMRKLAENTADVRYIRLGRKLSPEHFDGFVVGSVYGGSGGHKRFAIVGCIQVAVQLVERTCWRSTANSMNFLSFLDW